MLILKTLTMVGPVKKINHCKFTMVNFFLLVFTGSYQGQHYDKVTGFTRKTELQCSF